MQILITDHGQGRTRLFSVSRVQLVLAVLAAIAVLVLLSGAIFHLVFLKATHDGWPLVGQVARLVDRDGDAQRDRYLRENLDAMATKVGEMQARMIKLEAMGDRVTGLAGVKPDDLKPLPAGRRPGAGGPFVPLDHPSLEQLNLALTGLEHLAEQHGDLFTLAESRLFETRLRSLMVPNSKPVDVAIGSGFGFRSDPFTGRAALHTGLDFPADPGTQILAAAGGVVVSTDFHPQYGNLVEVDHGNGLTTRYAHTSRILVKAGDLVKRGQPVALVGTSGRSTGPHLHFEVLVDGVQQDPEKFLAGGPSGPSGPLPPQVAAVQVPRR
ncbi:MAG TPA: M23 family metallopeptidase [Ideonella sp.]|nr:M23 family metallopeptidase [Ideonella sp.]